MDKGTMKALKYHGPHQISLDDVPLPRIMEPTDALLKVTTSTICGSDIHIMQGAFDFLEPGFTIGHEFCGEIVELGSSVGSGFKVGDRVAVSCISHCGKCHNCLNGLPQYCPVPSGGQFPISQIMGTFIDGCQQEYIRVPFAETGMYNIPESLSDDNVLFVGDILSTGYFGAEQCHIQPGDIVLVVGSGPVGMCAMACARLWGPSLIIAVDLDQSRLDTALKNGICDAGINAEKEDAMAKVMELTNGYGAECVIEANGAGQTIDFAIKSARVGGRVGIVGLPAGIYSLDATPTPAGLFFKHLTISWGEVPANHIPRLISLIEKGQLDLRFLITHRKPLNDIIEGYDIFGNKKDGCLKWVVTPYVR